MEKKRWQEGQTKLKAPAVGKWSGERSPEKMGPCRPGDVEIGEVFFPFFLTAKATTLYNHLLWNVFLFFEDRSHMLFLVVVTLV